MFYTDETAADAMEAAHERAREVDADADAMDRHADELHAHEARGFCSHFGTVGYLPTPVYAEQVGLKPGEHRCTGGCRTVFPSEAAWIKASTDPFAQPVKKVTKPGSTPLPAAQ
ncbi:hypothetical protein ACTWJ8_39765 (plasmid) [Streptomyces sp. SDT5-1]|uniref:hypothetical protein n=1 Tax=Streptomyces sp. SDT5-1 TaxID=3406418 RepID=UPI003FD02F63